MRHGAFIMATCTSVAIAAPFASVASGSRAIPRHATARHAVAHSALGSSMAGAAPVGVYFAPFPSTPFAAGNYIYFPAATPSPSVFVDPNGCPDTGTDCTTAQLCEFWGEC